MRPTLLYRVYVGASRLALPLLARAEKRKLRDAGQSTVRSAEKLGYASQQRPCGPLIWFHAASVGESLSVLSLIDALLSALPKVEVLVTSGTATSASLMAKRLPARCRHQFAPLDAPGPVQRFLAHWRPNAAIFVESELWPNTLNACHSAGLPVALVNARLSDRSLARWRKFPATAQFLFNPFRLILTQTADLAEAMGQIGADPSRVATGVNLKALSAPLPVDDMLKTRFESCLDGRPVWIAASTHPGEESQVFAAHAELLASIPDLCLILAPRHPERSNAVAALIAEHGWPVLRRSAQDLPDGPVYLADSLGELGTWYGLSPCVFLGGSLMPIGGHNPFEVAMSGGAVISGAHVTNFQGTYDRMTTLGGAVIVQDSRELAKVAKLWLQDPTHLDQAKAASQQMCDGQRQQLDAVAQQLITALDLEGGAHHA